LVRIVINKILKTDNKMVEEGKKMIEEGNKKIDNNSLAVLWFSKLGIHTCAFGSGLALPGFQVLFSCMLSIYKKKRSSIPQFVICPVQAIENKMISNITYFSIDFIRFYFT
jgi:hypothetical protein